MADDRIAVGLRDLGRVVEVALVVVRGDLAGRQLLRLAAERGGRPRQDGVLDLLERLARPLAFPLRETHLRHDAAFQRRKLQLRLHDIALGAGDVALIAVEDRERKRQADGPRVRTQRIGRAIVLIRDRVIEQVDVVEPVGTLQVHLGARPGDAQPCRVQVGPAAECDGRQFLRGGWFRKGVVQPAPWLEGSRLLDRHVEENSQPLLGVGERFFRLAQAVAGPFEHE